MSAAANAPGYKELLARQMLGAKPEESAEASLDALLKEHLERGAKSAPGAPPASSVDPLDLFRQRLTGEYLDALEEVSRKYEPRGVGMSWNFGSVLQGGRDLEFVFTFGEHCLKLRGQLARDVVAFQEVRGRGGLEGELRSGGMLRLRTLTASVLREFLCAQIVSLVKLVMREQRSSGQ